ncbi:phage integrase SAM-like domain-containing protein [Spirosoma harenae]
MRILFKLRRNKRDGAAKATIYCRIKVDGQNSNDFSTFISLMPDQWDSDAQRIKGKSLKVHDNNLRLAQIHSDLTRLFLQLQQEDENLTAQELADIFTKKKKVIYTFWELVDLFEQHVYATYKNKGTRRNYQTRIDNIRLFLEESNLKKLTADKFNLGKADEFVRWAKSRGLDHQYIVRHTQVLKNITEDAVRRKIMKVDKLAVFKLKKKEKINTAHLSIQEIELLDAYDWRPPCGEWSICFCFLFIPASTIRMPRRSNHPKYGKASTAAPGCLNPGVNMPSLSFSSVSRFKLCP